MMVFVSLLFTWLAVTAVILYCYYPFPKKESALTRSVPPAYLIPSVNRVDLQQHVECAAFSSAYILRHFGTEADGNEIYKKYPRKLLDGTISPKGVVVFFRRLGYKATYFRGDVQTMKQRLTEGIPVIAFIREVPGKRYLHFVPVVGYDEEIFYLADSLAYRVNCTETLYNRKISIGELQALWQTWLPFNRNSYIIVQGAET